MSTFPLIIGVDEAGRGPLAGPVVAAAVILDPLNPIEGIHDSKLLSEKKREALYPIIQEKALAYGIGIASVEEIDTLNILQATFLAMQRAVSALTIKGDIVWVDGRDTPDFGLPTVAIIGGDALHPEIGAASILAKVTRDEIMVKYGKQFPNYRFEQHKGYGTQVHMDALSKYGVLNIHRKSFAPVRSQLALQETTLA